MILGIGGWWLERALFGEWVYGRLAVVVGLVGGVRNVACIISGSDTVGVDEANAERREGSVGRSHTKDERAHIHRYTRHER